MTTAYSSTLRVIRQAWLALMERKAQTWLSIAGVCAGVTAVIVLSMIAENGRQQIFREFETYGLNTIWIYRHWEEVAPGADVRQGTGITNDNLTQITAKCCPSVLRFSPNIYLNDWLRQARNGNLFTKASMQGVGVDFFQLSRERFAKGRGFSSKDISSRRMVAVIGPNTEERLFGSRSGLGQYFRVDGHRYLVIGVLARKDRSILEALGATEGYDINNRIVVPYTSYQSVLGGKDIHTLLVEAKNERVLHSAVEEVTGVLVRAHGSRFRYKSDTMEGWINTAEEILSVVNIIGISAALVSLIVGGIGIYNVMSTAVVDRTREIGIRKAIGARNGDILRQFLFEALFVGVVGSLLGMLIAVFISIFAYVIFNILLIPSWPYVLLAVALAIGIANIAGLRPAKRAAHMQPAVALRYD